MRGLLLALCFALVVALAVGTVAIRANNRALRHEISVMDDQRLALRLEVERREVVALHRETPEVLARRLRAFWNGRIRD